MKERFLYYLTTLEGESLIVERHSSKQLKHKAEKSHIHPQKQSRKAMWHGRGLVLLAPFLQPGSIYYRSNNLHTQFHPRARSPKLHEPMQDIFHETSTSIMCNIYHTLNRVLNWEFNTKPTPIRHKTIQTYLKTRQ